MKNNFENVEVIEEGEIITLFDENDQAHEFIEVGVVERDGEFFSLISPVTDDEEESGDVCIFKVEQTDDGEEKLIAVEDEILADAVFEEFMRAYANYEFEDGCGCGHEHCDCDHDHEHCDCDHDHQHCDCDHEHCDCHNDGDNE